MDDIADSQPRLGTGELTAIGDAFPALLPDRETVGERERLPAGARPVVPMPGAGHAPSLRPPTSILQAERQAKIVVFVAALAALAYFFHTAF